MRKVIIIDDRKERKKLHLSQKSITQLENLEDQGLLTISVGDDLSIESFDKMNDFDLIAIHRTFLTNTKIINEFIGYIKNNKKWLIVFSGGITQNSILLNGRQLNVNASDFYNEKLIPFILDYGNESVNANPLLYFLYGQSWRLTLLLQYRYLLWEYGDMEDIIDTGSDNDIRKEEELRTVLWSDGNYRTFEEVSQEIEIEKLKKQNL